MLTCYFNPLDMSFDCFYRDKREFVKHTYTLLNSTFIDKVVSDGPTITKEISANLFTRFRRMIVGWFNRGTND